MEALIYIGKVSLYWGAFYACYWLFLRRSTFFVWNRVYLLGTLLGAFFLPFLSYPSSVPVMPSAVYAVTVLPVSVVGSLPKADSSTVNWMLLLWITYFTGLVFMAIRLFRNIKDLLNYIRQGEVMEMEGFKLLLLPYSRSSETISSFSFLNWVVVTQEDYENHLDEIMRHELVHVSQRHTVDILLIEILRVLFWFNPVLVLYKSSIQQLHEYLADQETGDRDEYAEFLLSYSMGVPVAVLANHFFSSSLLKERITMLYKERNSRWLLGRYFVIIPLLGMVLMLTAARERVAEAIDAGKFISKEFYNSTISRPEVAAVADEETALLMGTITDGMGNGLEGAHVVVKGGNLGATTDYYGRFSLGGIPLESKIVISFVGYEAQELVVTKKKQIVTIVLKRKLEAFEEVVVTGNLEKKTELSDELNRTDGRVFTVVEQNAEFPGGIKEMYRFLARNMKYPKEAAESNVQGKVFMRFVVNENGQIRDVEVLKKLGFGTDEEAMRVVLSMPTWTPGRQNGKAVAVQYHLPISFSLEKSIPAEELGKWQLRAESAGVENSMSTTIVNLDPDKKPLFIIDGKRQENDENKLLDSKTKKTLEPDRIESVSVIKGKEAIDRYGEDAKNGVITIITKK